MKRLKRIFAVFFCLLLASGILGGCGKAASSSAPALSASQSDSKPLKIVTTIFPEYDWVREILGDKADHAEVTMLLDNGVDLHSYQPTADDIIKISDCDLFIYVGGESDGWVEDALKEATNKDMQVINLLDVHRIEVETELPADVYLLRSRFGQITSQATFEQAEEMPMQVVSITPKADGNQLYQLKLAFQGKPDTRLSAGMNIGITIHIEGTDSLGSTFSLPLHAVVRQQEETYVWILEADSTVSKRKVVCSGIDGTGDAIISAGLNGTEQVVKAGVNALQEKEKVRVIDTESKTNVGGLI